MSRPSARCVAALLAITVIGGCGASTSGPTNASSTPPGGSTASPSADPISVVASTDVWGDIAAQIGGDRVHVTSLVNDPSQDPHAYEPSGRDELAVSRARLVIENGGGYDDFLSQMLDSLRTRPIVVTATKAARTVPSVDADNEHVWYDLDAVRAVAAAVADALTEAQPSARDEFHRRLEAFDADLDPLRHDLAAIRADFSGTPVAVTEPLPLYLLDAAGLVNVTPAAFTEAVEEGIDVSPSDLSDTLSLFTDRRVRLLVYNEQSVSKQTIQVLDAAKANHIAVLKVDELLPDGETYQRWMGGIIDELATELRNEVSR